MRASDPILADAVSGILAGSVAQEPTKRESDRMANVFFMIVNLCEHLLCIKGNPATVTNGISFLKTVNA